MKNLNLLAPLMLLLLVARVLAACTDSTWRHDPAVEAARNACRSQTGVEYNCVEHEAVAASNPEICRLVGIYIDDMCLQAVYEAADDPTICDRIYLQGVVPNCRAYYAKRTASATLPSEASKPSPSPSPTASPTPSPAPAASFATYTSPRFGFGFQYPTGWQPVGEDHYQGEDGFFQVSPYESLASGLSDAYHRLSFRMVRACSWELNTNPDRYGQDGAAQLVGDLPGRAQCLIQPGASAGQADLVLLIELPSGGFARVQADIDQMESILATLVYTDLESQEPADTVYPYQDPGTVPELSLQTRPLGELTLEEYSLFPSQVHTPSEEQLAGVLEAVRAKRDPWRELDRYGSDEERIAYMNDRLAPFGYRLELYTNPAGEPRINLFQGSNLLLENLFAYPLWLNLSLPADPVVDFVLVVEQELPEGAERSATNTGLWQIRSGKIQPWNPLDHLYEFIPILIDGQPVELFHQEGGRLWIERQGEEVFDWRLLWNEPLSANLDHWYGTWALEVEGSLVVDGQLMNPVWGYGEIFDYQLLGGKPFFFFEQDGQVGISYDGQELPVQYDEVIHGECCGGMNNPRSSEHMVWFYARREGKWYYVEIGEYE